MEKYVSQLMAQCKYGQMVPYIGWGGKQVMLVMMMMVMMMVVVVVIISALNMFIILNTQMLDWGASDFGTDLGRCHFIGAVQNEEESIKVDRCSLTITEVCRMISLGTNVNMTLSERCS